MEQHAGKQHSLFKRNWVRGSAVLATAALSLALATPAQAAPLTGVKDVKASDNVVTVTFAQGEGEVQGKITFLEEDIFRYNVDPAGEFGEYAKPRSEKHAAKIQAQPDSSDKYSHPQAKVDAQGDKFVITAGKTTIEFDKATALMTVKRGDKVVMEEKAALDLDKSATVQTLAKHDGENFFGGGTQNGRFIHTGNTINIANESNWVDGGVASPNPFYWSDAGYGVLRNTFRTARTTSAPPRRRPRPPVTTKTSSTRITSSLTPPRGLPPHRWRKTCCRITSRSPATRCCCPSTRSTSAT